MSLEIPSTATGAKNEKRRAVTCPPAMPADALLLSMGDVAAYLRMTPAAVRRLVDGRRDGSDGDLGERLRSWLVTLSPRRRYIRREPFMAWLRGFCGDASVSS